MLPRVRRLSHTFSPIDDYNKFMIMYPLALITSHRLPDERIRRVITRFGI